MKAYIDKSALVAEIEKELNTTKKYSTEYVNGKKKYALNKILSFLNTLEVKEVDLEKEMDKFYGVHRDKQGITRDIKDGEVCFDWKDDQLSNHEMRIAKHFYKLGLKTKGE